MNKIFIAMLISFCFVGLAQSMQRTQSQQDLKKARAANLIPSQNLSEEEQMQRAIEASKQEAGEKYEREKKSDEEEINQAFSESNLREKIAKTMQEQAGSSLTTLVRRTPQGVAILTTSGQSLKEFAWQTLLAKKQEELNRRINK